MNLSLCEAPETKCLGIREGTGNWEGGVLWKSDYAVGPVEVGEVDEGKIQSDEGGPAMVWKAEILEVPGTWV